MTAFFDVKSQVLLDMQLLACYKHNMENALFVILNSSKAMYIG